MTINEALSNYLADLEYNGRRNDRETLNYFSCGTPYFESDEEMNTYIDAIGSLITEEKTND
jgi:hypothetical protein